MFRLVTPLITILGMLAPVNAAAQSQEQDSKSPRQQISDVVTRIAYRSTYWTEGQRLRQACFALYHNGYYQLLRITQNGPRESLQGYLDQNQMVPLASMLKNIDFGRSRGGAVLRDSEVLMADIANDNEIVRHAWLDPDRRNPLPESGVRIVNWLQSFKPQNASPFNPREPADVCPAGRWQQLPGRL
jgi:hypothetical protein